jgi:soluble lytic murein transglycosylase
MTSIATARQPDDSSGARSKRGRKPSGPRWSTVRRRNARRRSVLWLAGGIALAVLVAVLVAPLFQKAIRELTLPLQDADIIRQQATEKHLDPALVAGVIYAETKFDARTSPAGALGLMQIEPQTAEFLARRSGATTFTIGDLGTPQVNIAYGTYYLRYLIDHYGGNVTLALAAYNAGQTNVDQWVRARGQGLTVDQIPFGETRAYVSRVLWAQSQYRHAYASQLGYG